MIVFNSHNGTVSQKSPDATRGRFLLNLQFKWIFCRSFLGTKDSDVASIVEQLGTSASRRGHRTCDWFSTAHANVERLLLCSLFLDGLNPKAQGEVFALGIAQLPAQFFLIPLFQDF
jgi:hypothetical protein